MSNIVAFTDNLDRDNIISLLKDVGVVVIKKATASPEEIYKLHLDLGYHHEPKLWCQVKKYPIFVKVTNQLVDGVNPGMFGGLDIDWHTDILYSKDCHEVLSLYAYAVPNGDMSCPPTTWCNTRPFFNKLPDDMKVKLQSLYTKFSYDQSLSFTNKRYDLHNAATCDLAIEQMKKESKTQYIHHTVNISEDDIPKYKKGRYEFEGYYKMIPNHPLGSNGIFFNMSNTVDIVDSNYESITDAKELFFYLKENLVDNPEYHYTHQWECGDLVIADKLTTMHRRDHSVPDEIERELWKAQWYYKTIDRIHYDQSL